MDRHYVLGLDYVATLLTIAFNTRQSNIGTNILPTSGSWNDMIKG
jgi:hypothetical protein